MLKDWKNTVKMSTLPKAIYTLAATAIKIPSAFFKELEQTIPKTLCNQKDPEYQSNPEKEKQSWRHHNSGLQAIFQSFSHQDSMVLAQKQTHRSMEQNRKPRNGPTTLWSTNLRESRKEYPLEKRQSPTNGVGKTE